MNLRALAFLLLAPLVPSPAPAAEPPARAEGGIETDGGSAVLLGRVWRKGDVIELPEGYLRVEEDAHPGEERGVGSFTVVAATPDPAAEGTGSGAGDEVRRRPDVAAVGGVSAEQTAPREAPCQEERGAYLAELWRSWGVEVKDPAALLDGLGGGDPRVAFAWLAIATDPIRPIAWNSTLRSRADALAACVRAAGR